MPKKLLDLLADLNDRNIPFEFSYAESSYTKTGEQIMYSLAFLHLVVCFDEKGEQVK